MREPVVYANLAELRRAVERKLRRRVLNPEWKRIAPNWEKDVTYDQSYVHDVAERALELFGTKWASQLPSAASAAAGRIRMRGL